MIHIIVPVHNRSKITNKFADCLLRQTYQNYNFVLDTKVKNDLLNL